MKLLVRDAVPEDYAKGVVVRRSCASPKTLSAGRDVYGMFDRYMGESGRGSMLDREMSVIESYLKNITGGKFNEK